jgi:hypothetical protein
MVVRDDLPGVTGPPTRHTLWRVSLSAVEDGAVHDFSAG